MNVFRASRVDSLDVTSQGRGRRHLYPCTGRSGAATGRPPVPSVWIAIGPVNAAGAGATASIGAAVEGSIRSSIASRLRQTRRAWLGGEGRLSNFCRTVIKLVKN